MKTKRIIIWSCIALLAVIVALRVSGPHPSFMIGQHQVRWLGYGRMIYMHHVWGLPYFGRTEGGDFVHGRLENKSTVYLLGPISVWSRRD